MSTHSLPFDRQHSSIGLSARAAASGRCFGSPQKPFKKRTYSRLCHSDDADPVCDRPLSETVGAAATLLRRIEFADKESNPMFSSGKVVSRRLQVRPASGHAPIKPATSTTTSTTASASSCGPIRMAALLSHLQQNRVIRIRSTHPESGFQFRLKRLSRTRTAAAADNVESSSRNVVLKYIFT